MKRGFTDGLNTTPLTNILNLYVIIVFVPRILVSRKCVHIHFQRRKKLTKKNESEYKVGFVKFTDENTNKYKKLLSKP